MPIVISTDAKNNRLQALADTINAGAAPSILRLMSGTQPAAGGTGGVLLSAVTMPADIVGTITNGVLVFAQITDGQVEADGIVTWARIVDGNGNWVVDMDAGDDQSAASLKLTNTQVYLGAYVSVLSGTIAEA